MSAERDLFSEALSLPDSDRARLAHDLLLSLDRGADPDADAAWVAEIERRAEEARQGTVELEDWSAVRARLVDRWRSR